MLFLWYSLLYYINLSKSRMKQEILLSLWMIRNLWTKGMLNRKLLSLPTLNLHACLFCFVVVCFLFPPKYFPLLVANIYNAKPEMKVAQPLCSKIQEGLWLEPQTELNQKRPSQHKLEWWRVVENIKPE